jgi:hypothetical protein
MKLMELYQDKIMGAIKGLDRIRFRGTLRWLATQRGLRTFMCHTHILLKDFSSWVNGLTARIRDSAQQRAQELGIEVRYLTRAGVDKESLAREIAQAQGITQGSICLFSVVEPCMAPTVKGDKATQKLDVVMAPRKCVWLYHYFDDPVLGFGHVRLQTWVPFNVFICLNGRHWLERQLQKQGIGYLKEGNCFPWIEDVEAAQRLLDEQLQTRWPELLNGLALGSCPALPQVLRPLRPEYYWSADETEWATDLMFKSPASLDAIYPSLLHHALRISDSPSVLRYLGRAQISPAGRIKGRAPREVRTDCRKFYEGFRVKHWLNHNSIKVYNKSGSILRIETTVNHTRDFKVFRPPADDARRPASWQRLRKGVSDLHRRCELSNQCNERYAEALASAQVEEKLKEVVTPACNRIRQDGKSYRGLNPWQAQDFQLLRFLAQGQQALNGFRNKDLRRWLYPPSDDADPRQRRRYAARTTRWIKLLRVHGLVRKVAKENRYTLTAKGQKFACALMSASAVDIKGLTNLAA